MEPTLEEVIKALQRSWSNETCPDASNWTKENPARGQCVASSLVMQDYFGGELRRYKVTGITPNEMHYCNILEDGTILDTTGSQYKTPVTLEILPVELKSFKTVREKRLADEATRKRYEVLKARVANELEKSAE